MKAMLDRILRIPPRGALIALSAMMMLLSAGRFKQSPPSATDDQTSNWWPVVNALLDGRGFTQCLPEYFPFCTEDSPSAMREPLPLLVHAAFAALTGRSLVAACVLQVLLNILALWLIHRLGQRLIGDGAGLLAAAIWAVYLPAYTTVLNVGGDQLATVLLLLAALRFERAARSGAWPDFLFAGLLFGMASLCRSACIAFGVAAGVTWFLGLGIQGLRNRFAGATALAMGVAIALLPWVVRNYLAFDKVVVGSTLSGYNLLRHNSAIAGEDYCHFVAAEEGQAYMDAFFVAHPQLTGKENEAEMNALYGAAGKKVISAYPGRYIKLCLYRSTLLWFNWRVNDAYGKPSNLFDHTMALQQAVLLGLMILGFFTLDRGKWPLVLAIALYCLLYMAVVARMRFLIPAMPFVILAGGAFLARALGKAA